MNTNYTRFFERVKNYLENDQLTSEPRAMYYINSSTLSLLNTAKSISTKKDKPLEEVTTPDLLKNYRELSDDIKDLVSSAFDKYVKIALNSDELSNRECQTLTKEIQQELASFLNVLKDFLDSCGALDHLTIQHNVKMTSFGLPKLSVSREQIDDEFDFAKNSRAPLPTLVTKSAFWVNKSVKYIENLKTSMLLFEKNHLPYTKENYDTLSEKDKITAIYKEQILTKFRNDFSTKLPENIPFNVLLILYSTIVQQIQNPEITDMPELLEDFDLEDTTAITPLLEELGDFHMHYDDVFAADLNYSAFSSDMYSISNNYVLENDLYCYKDTLMLMLGLQLMEQKQLPVPYISHFGTSYETNSRANKTVLNVDLPGYFMPASFHYNQQMLDSTSLGNYIKNFPEYQGFFKSSESKDGLSTFLLFAPSAEQKKYIKDEFRKAKSHPDSYRTKLLSQMNGMANSKWYDFETLVNKQQQH